MRCASLVFVLWSISHHLRFLFGLLCKGGRVYDGRTRVRHDGLLEWMESLSCIAIHWMIRALPFVYLPSWWQAIVISLIFEMSSSVWFSLQFAVNHETLENVLSDSTGHLSTVFVDSNAHRDFGAHQVITSHNYSVGRWFALQLSGGLNYQIEHHLYPSVHNRHYPALSNIVRETAKEFNLPYNASDTFWVGVQKHAKLLYVMGKYDDSDTILTHFRN